MKLHTTSTEQSLKRGPADMPDRGGRKPKLQSPSTQVPLGRKELPVANLTNKPSMGKILTSSSEAPLSRSASNPYEKAGISATKPEVPFGSKKRR